MGNSGWGSTQRGGRLALALQWRCQSTNVQISFRLQWRLSSFSGENFKDLGQWISPWVRMLKMMKVEGVFGENLSLTGQDPSVSKSIQLHVDIFRVFFINLRYILKIPLKWSVNFLKSWTSTGHFLNLTSSSVNNCWFSPDIGWKVGVAQRTSKEAKSKFGVFFFIVCKCRVLVATLGFERTNPYTRSLLDAQTLASKEPMYGLVLPSPTLASFCSLIHLCC